MAHRRANTTEASKLAKRALLVSTNQQVQNVSLSARVSIGIIWTKVSKTAGYRINGRATSVLVAERGHVVAGTHFVPKPAM